MKAQSLALSEKNSEFDQMRRKAIVLAGQRKDLAERYRNQTNQIQKMEKAVLMLNSIKDQDTKKFQAQLDLKNETILRQKKYIVSIKGQKASDGAVKKSAASIKMALRKGRPMKKKARPSRVANSRMEAGAVKA